MPQLTSDLLIEADEIVNGERAADYGHPYDNFSQTAQMWSAVLGVEVTPEQFALCMICVKISREDNHHKRDNLVDTIGYILALQKVIDRREELSKEERIKHSDK